MHFGPTMLEPISIASSFANKVTYGTVLSQLLKIVDGLVPATTRSISESLTVSSALAAADHVSVIEKLGIADLITGKMTAGVVISEQLSLLDSLTSFFGASVSEVLAVVDTLVSKRRFAPTINETPTISETLDRALLLHVVANENLSITPEQALQMFFSPTLNESMEISGAYLDSESMTTWVVNVTTGAVSEYSNFNFNSFARVGQKYIAASSTGIYELDGDTDAGADIIARIKGGMMQIGQSKFSSFKGIYLGVRGGGDFVLKIETGDGKTFVYSVEAKTMQTTRVHHGKGLRARYFSYELISTGQDFDLDSIEFVPLVAQRRV